MNPPASNPPRTEEDMQRLVHELEVYRLELEMQNTELRRTQQELESSRNRYAELYDFAPIANFTFDPPTLTVKAGTTVTWVNADDIPHLVTEKDGKFRSSALDTNDKFSQTFSTAGTVEYFCAIHPHMTGKIVVTP